MKYTLLKNKHVPFNEEINDIRLLVTLYANIKCKGDGNCKPSSKRIVAFSYVCAPPTCVLNNLTQPFYCFKKTYIPPH